jgi:hypothetical protein
VVSEHGLTPGVERSCESHEKPHSTTSGRFIGAEDDLLAVDTNKSAISAALVLLAEYFLTSGSARDWRRIQGHSELLSIASNQLVTFG